VRSAADAATAAVAATSESATAVESRDSEGAAASADRFDGICLADEPVEAEGAAELSDDGTSARARLDVMQR
jgi:hypothetical protein